jgi:hypothetical protein
MAITGYGGQLQVDISGTYTQVAEVKDIDGPNQDSTAIDVTHLQSPNNTREYLPGLQEPGIINVTANFTATGCNTMYGFFRVTKAWRALFSNGSKWDFSGHMSSFGTTIPLEEAAGMTFAIKVTGKPLFTM